MAIFLLLYVFFMFAWLGWSIMLTYLLIKHKLPGNFEKIHLIIYWGLMFVIITISVIFILRADWVSVPPLFQSLST